MLAKSLQDQGVAVYGVNLPGRNGRNPEKIMNRLYPIIMESAIEVEMAAINNTFPAGTPLFFLGHSFGGLLAFELIRHMEKIQSPVKVEKLILSAIHSPADLTMKNKSSNNVFHHTESDNELFSYIKQIGGRFRYQSVHYLGCCINFSIPCCVIVPVEAIETRISCSQWAKA